MATRYELPGVGTQDEGTFLGQATTVNFAGAGVTAVLTANLLTVTIPGGGGGGGTPALPFNSIQYNNAGAFGGNANFTWNGTGIVVTNGAGITDTLSPGTLLFTTAGTGTISVKTAAAADGPLNLDILDFQINGASGTAGHVLTSGGAAASPTWAAPVLTSVAVDAGELTNTGTATAPVLGLAAAGTAGTYASPSSVTTDAFGRVTSVTAGTAPLVPAVATTSASPYVVGTSTTTVFADPLAAQTIHIPAANAVGVVPGRSYTVKRANTSANVVTVTSAGGTIDFVAAGTGIALAGGTLDSITVQSDGANWWIV